MARRNSAVKKPVLPDPIYKSQTVTKLINQVMFDGKKGLAQRIVYGAFDIIKEKQAQNQSNISIRLLKTLNLCLKLKQEE